MNNRILAGQIIVLVKSDASHDVIESLLDDFERSIRIDCNVILDEEEEEC